MDERGAADDPLIRVVAVDDAVDRAEERVLVAHETGVPRGRLLHDGRDVLDPLQRIRMRLEPVRHALARPRRLVETSERRQHLGHARGIPVRACRVADAELIGL